MKKNKLYYLRKIFNNNNEIYKLNNFKEPIIEGEFKYFNNLIKIISKNNSFNNLVKNIINPYSSYFLCKHFIGDEVHKNNIDIPKDINDILKTNNISLIKELDIVQCQVDYFDFFINKILPKLDKKIILITSQWMGPQILKSKITDDLLLNKNIALWISQNPIYINNSKYIPFPYGIYTSTIVDYATVLIKNIQKTININHLCCNITNKCRIKLPKVNQENSLNFYINMSKSKYVLSPIGDRDDCYRHYECIGLETIPISNVSELYYDIFKENMYYCDIDKMLSILKNNKIDHEYFIPNKNLISFDYHKDILLEKIKNI